MVTTKKSPKAAARPVNVTAQLFKAWSIHSQDGIELKVYIEMGFCDGYAVPDIVIKYPQFNVYDRKTLYNTVNRLRKKANENVENRGGLKDGCKCDFDTLIVNIILLLFMHMI